MQLQDKYECSATLEKWSYAFNTFGKPSDHFHNECYATTEKICAAFEKCVASTKIPCYEFRL